MTTWLSPAHLALSLIILVWDVVLAGRISQLREAPRPFAAITGLVALLLAPALLIHLATSTMLTGRGLAATDWIWPAILVLMVVQSGYALARRLVNPLWGLPIFAYNTVLCIAGVVRHAVAHGYSPDTPLMAFLTAQSIGMTIATASTLTMITPFYIDVPMIAPAFPALRRTTLVFRIAMTMYALLWMGMLFFGLSFPRAIGTLRAFNAPLTTVIQARPSGDFRIGLKLFPDIASIPSPAAVKNDLAMVDSLGTDVFCVVVVPGASRVAIDSLAHILERRRGDSTIVILAIGYRGVLVPEIGHPPLDAAGRIATLTYAVTALRPTIVLPAEDPYGIGARVLGELPVDTWQRYLTDASAAAKRAHPATKVGVSIARYRSADSTLYAWAARSESPIDILGFTLFPPRLGLEDIDAFEKAADRWMKTTPSGKPHWLFAAGGYPLVYGERAQEKIIMQTISWATAHPNIKGVVIYEAGDYGEARGLRAPNGRIRVAARAVARAIRLLKESITM